MWYSIIIKNKGGNVLKGKDYRLRKILYQLKDLQSKKVKSVQWRLKQEQLEFLSKYFEIRPFLYIVNTRRFRNIYNIKNSLIKRIHYANKSGKSQIVGKFNPDELKTLRQFQIPYKPCKYLILLNSWNIPQWELQTRSSLKLLVKYLNTMNSCDNIYTI